MRRTYLAMMVALLSACGNELQSYAVSGDEDAGVDQAQQAARWIRDDDGDGVRNGADNCPKTANGGQEDADGDGRGDLCDNCVFEPNRNQRDRDRDQLGDACDNCPRSSGQQDACGVCGGDGTSCLGCDNVPNSGLTLDTCGVCGGDGAACAYGYEGTYAAKIVLYSKTRQGTTVTDHKATRYSIVNISTDAQGQPFVTEQLCYGLARAGSVYQWSKLAWASATPPQERTLRFVAGKLVAEQVRAPVGWDAARQPATCQSAGQLTSAPGFPAAWGTTCTCNLPNDNLPPYDNNLAPYDCRSMDTDLDGYPGVSAAVDLNEPSSPQSEGNSRAMYAAEIEENWDLSPSADGTLRGTSLDLGTRQIIGCRGLACSAIGGTPRVTNCAERFNRVTLKPSSAISCDTLVANRATLFAAEDEGRTPTLAECPVQ